MKIIDQKFDQDLFFMRVLVFNILLRTTSLQTITWANVDPNVYLTIWRH